MENECNIIYEKSPFYAYRTRNGIEIRKNKSCGAVLIGVTTSEENAIRFIDRAALYPERF